MNREYSEKLFDLIPSDQRKKILRSKMKGSISGFRRLDLAPSGILKSTMKNNEAFATQFLDAVMDMYDCPSEPYTGEEQFPKLTSENFWGLFAWKCKTLDDSPESCEILEAMVQEYGKLITSDLPHSAEYVAALPVISEALEQGDSKVVDNKIHERPNIGVATQEEDHMSEFTQYIGYIQETNGYYNYWPVCVVRNGTVESFEIGREEFPELGNINLFSTPWDYVRGKCYSGEICVITLSSSDLKENRRQDGYFQRTNYKVDFNQLERQGRIKRLEDIQMYPVLHPAGPIDFAGKTVILQENSEDVDERDKCLIEENGILYGPYLVEFDADGKAFINLTSNDVVNSYRPKNGVLEYTIIRIDVPGKRPVLTSNIRIDDKLIHEQLDKISDQKLFEAFLNSLENRKDHGEITPGLVDEYVRSSFRGLSDKIIHDRVERIQQFVEEQFRLEKSLEGISRFVADLLLKYGERDYFSKLLEHVLSNSDLARKIQSFAIVEQRIQDMRLQFEELQRQYDEAQKKWEAETEDRNKQIAELASSTSDEIRALNAQKEALLAEISNIQGKRDEWKKVDDLEIERRVLERTYSDRKRELEDEISKLKQDRDEYDRAKESAKKALEEKLDETARNTVNAAFDGKIADQVLQAAAKWNQTTQDDDFRRIAAALTRPIEQSTISGDELVKYLLSSVRHYRPGYSQNEILNIFLCITQNFLTVFSGEPGTGKTSICNIVAHILGTSQIPSFVQDGAGIELSRYVPISIERGWTSKRDFIGYYNPLSQAFEQTNKHLYDGLRLLDVEGERSRYPYIVLLDEANLSPIEYYWADFMNACDSDSRFSKITLGDDIQLKIPTTLRFVATINNDDTTERLSPRLIDRAALIRLPDVPYARIEDENLADTSFVKVVEWENLQAVFAPDTSLDLDKVPDDIYNGICKLFRENKFSVSPRVDRAIRRYWAVAKNLFESESGNDATIIALDYAVAQKLLPKINGSGKAYSDFLGKFQELCEKSNLEKSRTVLTNIIKRGETSMGYYQYF